MKKIENIYVKYTAKKPILFFLLVLVSVSLILFLTVTTKTNLFLTCDASIERDKIIVDGLMESCTGQLYVYDNREEQIYPVEINETVQDDGTTIFYIADAEALSGLPREVKADIPADEISLFERIFIRGGKSNE